MKNLVQAITVTVCVAGVCAAGQTAAQVRPDAGQTLREGEKTIPLPSTSPEPAIFLPVDPRVGDGPDSASIGTVDHFTFSGTILIPAQELTEALTPWLHRPLTFNDLKAASDMVTRIYRERGYPVARAYIPEQTLEGNVVDIAVMVSRLGKLTVNNHSRIAADRLQAYFNQSAPGTVIRSAPLERGLLLVQDLAGVASVTATLQPGEAPNETNALVTVEPAPFVSGAVDMDNYGNRYTGAYRGGLTLNLNSPAGMGDQLAGRVQASNKDLLYGRFTYRVPVGSAGNVVGASYSKSQYQLGSTFAALDANGTARASSLFTSYPFVRSQEFNLTGTVTAENKALEDRIEAIASVTNKSMNQVTVAVTASGGFDRGGGYSTSAAVSKGDLKVAADPAHLADDSAGGSAGHFAKLAYSATAIWPLSGPWSVLASGNGQFSNKNLDSSEKFSLGGGEAVRAYPQGEATGDEGLFLSSELRYGLTAPLPGTFLLAGFVDYGVIRANHTRLPDDENRRDLAACGVSLSWNTADNFTIKGTFARRIGGERSTADRDASYRFWVQAIKSF